jgi:hypothetical protein
MEKAPSRVGAIEVAVAVPYLPQNQLDRFQKAIEHCSVHNTMKRPPQVSITTSRTDAGSEVA